MHFPSKMPKAVFWGKENQNGKTVSHLRCHWQSGSIEEQCTQSLTSWKTLEVFLEHLRLCAPCLWLFVSFKAVFSSLWLIFSSIVKILRTKIQTGRNRKKIEPATVLVSEPMQWKGDCKRTIFSGILLELSNLTYSVLSKASGFVSASDHRGDKTICSWGSKKCAKISTLPKYCKS